MHLVYFIYLISAHADVMVIHDAPAPFTYEASTTLEFVRQLSHVPTELHPTPLKEHALFSTNSNGELIIDIPGIQSIQKEIKKRKPKKFDAQKFITPDVQGIQDPSSLSVRLLKHTIQESIDDQTDDQKAQKGLPSNALAADIPWFKTAGFQNRFQVQLRAADSSAALSYKGLADASLSYQSEQKAVGFEIKRKFLQQIDIIYAYTLSPIETKDLIKLSWNF